MSSRSSSPSGRRQGPDAGRVASHLAVMAAVAVVMGVLVACLAIPFAGIVGVAAKDVSKGMVNLPESLEAKDLSQKTRIYDVNGNLIASLYDQNRINVSLGSISRPMVKAIVAIEDYRFYDHGALDLKGTLRAFITNQANGGSVQGGSSITQQMVKQTLLYQAETDEERKAATEETYARKVRELRYAIAFEQNHSKDWILERYLNIAYFGDGAFGVQSAARHFFSKNAKDLNMLEAATLAGLVKNPVGYDPVDNPERAESRRNVVLDRMAQLGILTEKKAERLKNRPLEKTLDIETSPNGCQQSRAPFFCDYVVNWLLKDPVLGDTPKERRRTLNNGGLTINTTIDLDMQKAADDSVSSHVFQTDQAIGGLAMIEPGTGDVRALAQSRPMGKDKLGGETYLNYTVPKKYGDANGFQAGSTFKLFVLAAAINQGIPLSTGISSPQQMDIPDYEFETCDGPYAGEGSWPVANSTGAGTFNLYTGTQVSVNTFFAQLEMRTGMCEPLELAKQMGVTVPPEQQVPSWILGVSDTDPLTMAQAYATFAARGLHCDPRPVTAVLDSSGEMLKEFPSECEQVMPSATADAVNDILRGVMEPGGFGQNIAIDKPSAGKTGTNNSNMAVWFVGYTPKLATAAMVAGANEFGEWLTLNGQVVGGSYISSAFGSTVAGPIWGDAMAAVSPKLDYEDFQAPPGDEIAGVLAAVPDVTGQSVEAATATLQGAGFTVADGGQVNSEMEEGLVASTSPDPGTRLSSGDPVTLYTSTGYVPPPPKGNGGGKGRGGRGGGRGNG
ncbi:transglycosylase domain-containing protein [Nocardioides sp. zg-1228]|uniref:transglycosylase domain-containing protein n=1 Tax=Nocardioides sp. zg-1228 TaxID=2763008 RepID=UPI0016430421|nr:transglycosylase domain-containing protein [Nocardioides sp. zg-1228]MBC2932401.1 penicillin-binding protein [Nocardioides sp. zg-1228]QSF57913.1 penicillin-binding protein [Nocardioides sp. zg-1228]